MPVCGKVRGTRFANEFALLGGGTLAIGFGREGPLVLGWHRLGCFAFHFLPSVPLFLVDFNLN